MMGVNPLIDSALIQANAKGVGSPVERANVVPPVNPGEPLAKVSAETRLADSGGKQSKGIAAYQANGLPRPTPSTVTTLNEAARTIADILMKYPPGLAPAIKLVPLQRAQLLQVDLVKQHLKNQVVTSGLFYESHVARSFKGGYALEALALEPQFKGFMAGDGQPVATDKGWALFEFWGRPGNPASSQPNRRSHREKFDPATVASEAARAGDSRFRCFMETELSQQPRNAHERQQFMIRHQLDLLSNSTLRIEGEIAPGYPMTILFQRSYEGFVDTDGKAEAGQQNPIVWHCLLRLEHPSFKFVDYDLQLSSEELRLNMSGYSALLQEYFRRDEAKFRDRLSAMGINSAHFSRTLVSRLEPMGVLKLPQLSTPNAYTKRTQSAFEHEYGQQADHVISYAEQKGIPINMSAELMGLLMQLDFDQVIPDSLYAVCADLATWTREQINHL